MRSYPKTVLCQAAHGQGTNHQIFHPTTRPQGEMPAMFIATADSLNPWGIWVWSATKKHSHSHCDHKGLDQRKALKEDSSRVSPSKFREALSATQISSKSRRSKECSWRHCSFFGGKSSKGTFSEIFGGQWSKISVECGFMHLPALQIAAKNQLQECLWPGAFQFVEMKPLVWVWVWITFKLCIANHNRKDPYECLWGAKRFPEFSQVGPEEMT